MPAAESQFAWLDWAASNPYPGANLGFRPLDVTTPTDPVVVEDGVYAVSVTIWAGDGDSSRIGETHTGAGMWAYLGLDDDGYGWILEGSASLDAAATNGYLPAMTISGTVYLPADSVIRLYFSHSAPDPSDFTMYAIVQRVA